MTALTSRLYGFTKVIKFVACINKFLCKNCLYDDYSQFTLGMHVYTYISLLLAGL